ncbi:hypothetical protein GOP47_0004065 [Adiantum capillus-veneris]|uniref:Uncharacterized protein n=1 Tax=Adiantum capillus-veneris TaxID=13818 RepID=A0A9D4V7F7_ADICA|nr:hypothetical protein GOP47_0004065 [Adiantum capillus-veneris]
MADKGKKAKVEDEDGSEPRDSELFLTIQKLQEVQDELEKVNEEASDKVLEVEQKYNKIRKPVYQKRSEIIQRIPDFWLTAFLSHPALSEILTDNDQKVFKFLQSLEVDEFPDIKSGYSITFTFNSNPYFENSSLAKSFHISEEGTTTVKCSEIKWQHGMDFTNGVKHAVGTKRSLPEESFFKWFVETGWTQDEIADIIREDLWPNPLKYFHNDQDDEDDEDDDDEDDDDDEEFDDEGGENEGQGEGEEDGDEDEDEEEDE